MALPRFTSRPSDNRMSRLPSGNEISSTCGLMLFQGTDSFFPYRAGSGWQALYGSARSEVMPIAYWWVGMASSPSPGGPWRRLSRQNPARIEKSFIENPIVTPLRHGGYLCVYDSNVPDAIGYAYSRDGVKWNPGAPLIIQPRTTVWSHDVRTPLGLIPEGGNLYTVFYTGFEQKPDWERLLAGRGGNATCAIGVATVRLELE